MSLKQFTYLFLSFLGAVCTWYFNVQYFQGTGTILFSPIHFAVQAGSTPAGASMSMDALITGLAAIVWMLTDANKIGMKHAWAYIAFGSWISFTFLFPLFLFMRERHLDQQQIEGLDDQAYLMPGKVSEA